MINCVIIEDEPLAQSGLINLMKDHSSLYLLSVCDDIKDFLSFQKTNQDKAIDLIFLDIELPGMNGINFLQTAELEIPVVLTTAYNEFAMEGYELNVLDYLLKPISKVRFKKTIEKAENYINFLRSNYRDHQNFLYIKSDKAIEKVFHDEIILIESMRNYVIYHCDKRKLICYTALKNVEQNLPSNQFVKIQKSFIVNKNRVEKIERGSVFIYNKNISIKREKRNDIIKRLLEK